MINVAEVDPHYAHAAALARGDCHLVVIWCRRHRLFSNFYGQIITSTRPRMEDLVHDVGGVRLEAQRHLRLVHPARSVVVANGLDADVEAVGQLLADGLRDGLLAAVDGREHVRVEAPLGELQPVLLLWCGRDMARRDCFRRSLSMTRPPDKASATRLVDEDDLGRPPVLRALGRQDAHGPVGGEEEEMTMLDACTDAP